MIANSKTISFIYLQFTLVVIRIQSANPYLATIPSTSSYSLFSHHCLMMPHDSAHLHLAIIAAIQSCSDSLHCLDSASHRSHPSHHPSHSSESHPIPAIPPTPPSQAIPDNVRPPPYAVSGLRLSSRSLSVTYSFTN